MNRFLKEFQRVACILSAYIYCLSNINLFTLFGGFEWVGMGKGGDILFRSNKIMEVLGDVKDTFDVTGCQFNLDGASTPYLTVGTVLNNIDVHEDYINIRMRGDVGVTYNKLSRLMFISGLDFTENDIIMKVTYHRTTEFSIDIRSYNELVKFIRCMDMVKDGKGLDGTIFYWDREKWERFFDEGI